MNIITYTILLYTIAFATITIISIIAYITLREMNRKYNNNIKEWKFARKVLLEIKKQEKFPFDKTQIKNDIAYNVALLRDKDIPIEKFGEY